MALDYSTLLNNINTDAIDLNVAKDTSSYKAISQWLGKLYLLKGVPFHYLVPHPEMLPWESIKYFTIDNNWLTALIDGAFSIGRSVSSTAPNLAEWLETQIYPGLTQDFQKIAKDYHATLTNQTPPPDSTPPNLPLPTITGFLLRSQAVSDFKSMKVVGYEKSNIPSFPDSTGTPMKILRLEHLSKDVMIGLFYGTLYQLDFKEPSEGLHFGFEPDSVTYDSTSNVTAFQKDLRYIVDDSSASTYAGQEINDVSITTSSSNIFRDTSTITSKYKPVGGVINVNQLSAAMYNTLGDKVPYHVGVSGGTNLPTSLTSADFALQFTEGTSKVSFFFTPPS